MGGLMADTTRLVEEIRKDRDARHRLLKAVASSTAEMKRSVGRTVAGFRKAHLEATKRQHKNLREFVVGIERTVGALRSGVRADLAGAHAAWRGIGSVTRASEPMMVGREQAKRAAKRPGG